MTRPTSNDQARGHEHEKSLREQEGHREDKHDVSLEVERQQQASDHTNVQQGSAPASNEHGGKRLVVAGRSGHGLLLGTVVG
jgi:hypothetical protein